MLSHFFQELSDNAVKVSWKTGAYAERIEKLFMRRHHIFHRNTGSTIQAVHRAEEHKKMSERVL